MVIASVLLIIASTLTPFEDLWSTRGEHFGTFLFKYILECLPADAIVRPWIQELYTFVGPNLFAWIILSTGFYFPWCIMHALFSF